MPDGSARRIYRTWILDGRRWDHYRPRAGDIVIATSPKCGTTWMQRIVALLVFQSPDRCAVADLALDRAPLPRADRGRLARLEAQEHRRFVKTHLPLDGLPDLPGARWIHVARDGRDACLSYHHHCMGFTAEALAALDREGTDGRDDRPPYPPIATRPGTFFQDWLERGIVPGHADGFPFLSYFHLERTFWQRRADSGVSAGALRRSEGGSSGARCAASRISWASQCHRSGLAGPGRRRRLQRHAS